MAAITAIATAKLKHKHVGIRPRKERGLNTRTIGMLVPPQSDAATGFNEALGRAGQAWPDDNAWEVFGSDGFGDFPDKDFFGDNFSDDDPCDNMIGDGWFDHPCVYGEFATVAESGYEGGYPA
jgi:hypothetical protein